MEHYSLANSDGEFKRVETAEIDNNGDGETPSPRQVAQWPEHLESDYLIEPRAMSANTIAKMATVSTMPSAAR